MEKLSRYNALARYPDMPRARGAIEALSRAGVEAGDISLLGRAAEEASAARSTRDRDSGTAGDVAKKTASGAAVGSAVGAALAGGAAFLVPGIGPVLGAGIWAATAAGAVAGGTAGGMVRGVASLPLNEDWELTYHDDVEEGQVLVAVHAHDEKAAERAAKTLDKAGASSVELLDAAGHLISRAA